MSVVDVNNPRMGLRIEESNGIHSIIRLPRNESLRILPKSGMNDIFNSMLACEAVLRKPLERGDSRRIFGDGPHDGPAPMYSAIGVQVSRFGGVIDSSPSLLSLSDHHWRSVIKMARRAEAALESFADTSVLCQLTAAKEVVDFKTLSAPNSDCNAKYFGAMAFGCNVFLRCHTDEDFSYTVSQCILQGQDCCSVNDHIVAYFCFPTRGVAIPMRPGDYVMFDARLPHCISSRCHIQDRVMAASFYLKSMVVGLNDNSIPLSCQQNNLAMLQKNMVNNM